jgi:NAD(P)-dependent dehydrogenase (short-subunit alcohol dehydrogenase family)
VLFTYELARRLEGSNVTANVLHPGFVRTKFGHNNNWIVRNMTWVVQRIAAISVEAGAQTQIYLASSPEVEGVTGQYFVKKKSTRSNKESYNEDIAKRLWDVSEEMTGIRTPVGS